MRSRFDALVIGSGVAGGVAAGVLARAGRRVAVADYRPYGGTCPLRGCEPKKVFADATHLLARFRKMRGNGLVGDMAAHWPALQRFKRSFTDPVPERAETRLRDRGVTTLHGLASFEGPRQVRVGEDLVEADKILVATGARPRALSFPGADLVASSDEFLDLETLPRRIGFVGGGYISMEFAHVAVAAGASVSIFQRSDRCLRRFDADLVGELCRVSAEAGIVIHFNAPVQAVERQGDACRVRAGRSGEVAIEVDAMFHGAGRAADVTSLACAKAGVECSEAGVTVDEWLQSVSNPAVYAAGDVAGRGPQLTPVAVMEAQAAAWNMLHGPQKKPDYAVVPSVAFTHPVIAAVGLLEEEAQARGIPYRRKFRARLDWPEYRRLGETDAAYKILVHPERKTILGAHLLGEKAEETINVLALAMRHGLTVDQLMDMVWAYPSFGYALRYMLHDLAEDVA